MTIVNKTHKSALYKVPGHEKGSAHFSGKYLVSIGVKTDVSEKDFTISQAFVNNDGEYAFIEINNSSSKEISWQAFATSVADEDQQIPTAEIRHETALSK